jgi:hypothetical protein
MIALYKKVSSVVGVGNCFIPSANRATTSILTLDPISNDLNKTDGPTAFLPLREGSASLPLIDAGDPTYCPLTDQRGHTRLGVCDIGAVEWRPATPRNADSVGLYYKTSSQFYLRHPDASQTVVTFGDPAWDAYPVAGDWDGDGQDTVGLYHRGEGKFYLRNSNTTGGADATAIYGNPGDIPIVGRWSSAMNYDGIGVFRDDGTGIGFYTYQKVNAEASGGIIFDNFYVVFGDVGDIPVAGDWDGDGYDSIGVYSPNNGVYMLSNSITGNGEINYIVPFGEPSAHPFTGGWRCYGASCQTKITGLGYYRNGIFTLAEDLLADSPLTTINYTVNGNSTLIPGVEVWPLSGYWSQTELSYAGTATPTPSRTPTVTPTIEGCTNPYPLNGLIVPPVQSGGGGGEDGSADGGSGGVPPSGGGTPVYKPLIPACQGVTTTPRPTATPLVTPSALLCSEQMVRISPVSPNGQVLKDMLVENAQGVALLVAPAMNARKLSVRIPWGTTNLLVSERIVYNGSDVQRQVWYKVTYNSYVGWIPALFQTLSYVVEGDPCWSLNIPQPVTLVFEYDRYIAALYALEQSAENNKRTSLANLRVSSKLSSVPNLPYAAFYNGGSTLSATNTEGSSGSGIFLSEALWIGGLPFVKGEVQEGECAGNQPNGGWKYCADRNIPFGSRGWLTEPGQLRQFIVLPNAPSLPIYPTPIAAQILAYSGNIPVQNNVMPLMSKGSFVAKAKVPNSPDSSGGYDINQYFSNVQLPNNTLNLSEMFNFNTWVDMHLSSLKSGDYLWINATGSAHALLIVGWGPMENCSVSYNGGNFKKYTLLSSPNAMPSNLTELSQRYNSASQRFDNTIYYYVPYVADFSGLGGANSLAPQVQNSTARPFYCTQSATPQRFGFTDDSNGRHYWYFMQLPDQVTVKNPVTAPNALDRLFIPSHWNWNASGALLNRSGVAVGSPP